MQPLVLERSMRTRSRPASLDAEWDEVWAHHDARRGVVPAPGPAVLAEELPERPNPAAATRRGGGRWALFSLALALPLLWAAEPVLTAWQVSRALETGDARLLGRHVDSVAVQEEMRERLGGLLTRAPDGQAGGFLEAMADDMARAWSSPAAIAGLARARQDSPRVQSVGLTSFELVVPTATAPMTLRLELGEGALMPRWQVTGVRMDMPVPQHAPPPTRLSAR
jgi:hypothetical protein